MAIAKDKKTKKKGSANKAAPKPEGTRTITTTMEEIMSSSLFQQTPEAKAEMQRKSEKMRDQLETAAKRQIDFFIVNETEKQKPESILFDLFCHQNKSPSDGIFQAQAFVESLTKFLMVPEHMTAFQAINSSMTAEQVAAFLLQMSWALRELSKDGPIAIFNKIHIGMLTYNQVFKLFHHYCEKNIIVANAHIAEIMEIKSPVQY